MTTLLRIVSLKSLVDQSVCSGPDYDINTSPRPVWPVKGDGGGDVLIAFNVSHSEND